jgi:hypothetical protein
MPNLFDKLPLDVIHYVILPFNDYDTRNALNMVLAPHERKSTPLAKDATIKFRLIQAYPWFQRGVTCFDNEKNADIRTKAIIEFIDILRKYSVILEYNKTYRNACINKFRSFVNLSTYKNMVIDPIIKNKLITEATSFLHDIENKYSYKYNVQGITGNICFINGVRPHHIVDNSIY